MPSQLAHSFHGEAALDALPSPWSRGLSRAVFRLGCQGPDIFYHNRRTKPGAFLYGTRLHRRAWGESVARFRHQVALRGWGPDHPGAALALGWAAHGFLDRRAHPLVVAKAGWRVPGRPDTEVLRHAHSFLERIFDVKLWQTLRPSQALAECPWQDEVPGPDDLGPEVFEAWADALHPIFPQLSTRDELPLRLAHAVADTRGFLAYTSPTRPDHARRAALHGALHYIHPAHLPDLDFLNLGHAPWPDPLTGRPRTESFLDLFEAAADDLRTLYARWDDPRADVEALAGNGSLNLPGEEGEAAGPVHCEPWDYADLYDREVRGRLGAGGGLVS